MSDGKNDSFPEVQARHMTLRQYSAIQLRVPNSGTPWLDEMIRESLRNDMAAKAMVCEIKDGVPAKPEDQASAAKWSYAMADAMLAESAKGGGS